MKRRARIAVWTLGASLFTTLPAASASDLTLEVTIAPAEITVGDRARATVVLPATGETTDIPVLELGDRWGDTRVVAKELVSGPGAGREPAASADAWIWEIELTAFRPGSLELPPLTAVVPGTPPREVSTAAPPTLTVRSVLPEGGEVTPRPPTAPEAWPGLSPWWWIAAPLLAAALLALLLWHRRRRRGPAGAAATAVSPIAALERDLRRLRELEDGEALHTGLSIAIRRYLERRIGFPAAEHTTTEIRHDLAGRALPDSLARTTIELLRRCDDVKFARRDVPLSTARDRTETALELARQIEEALRPPEPEEDAA